MSGTPIYFFLNSYPNTPSFVIVHCRHPLIFLFSHTHTQYLNNGSDDNPFPKESAPITFWSNTYIDVAVTTAIWNHTKWVYKSLYWYHNNYVESVPNFISTKNKLSTALQRSGLTEYCITALRFPSIDKKPRIFEG